MAGICLILCFYLLTKLNIASSNLTFTNSSAYFKQSISTSEILLLQNKQYNGISANMSFSIQYTISNISENKLVSDLLSTSLKQTLKTEYSNIGDEQIIIYNIKTLLQQLNQTQFKFTTTVFTAILTYTIDELQNINTFILSTFETQLQIILNNTFSKNIKSLNSITVNKGKTTINNVLIDTNDLYGTNNNTTEDTGEKELLFIFIVVAIIMVILISGCAVFIMKRRFNKQLDGLEESLLETDNQNDSQENESTYIKPQVYKTSISVPEHEQIELQSKHDIQTIKGHRKKKISSYDWETPGYDGNTDDNAPDTMDDIDSYLAQSDEENEDMYTPSEVTDATPQ
eukprot:7451_1